MSNRRHSSLHKELPLEVREEVHRLLVENVTYDDIKAYLDNEGYEISRSAIGRYGKNYFKMYQSVRIIEEQSKALVSNIGEGMKLEEAVSKIFLKMIMEAQINGELDIKKVPRMISDFAKLQSSNVSRERYKDEIKTKVKKTASEIQKIAKKAGVSDETNEQLYNKVLGISD